MPPADASAPTRRPAPFTDEDLRALVPRGPWQRSLRWQKPEINRRRLALGIVFAIVMTLIELAGFVTGMHRSIRTARQADRPIEVSVIDLAPVQPLPPEPQPAALPVRPSRIAVTPPQARIEPPPPATAEPQTTTQGRIGPGAATGLFNADGSVRLPERTGAPATPANPQQAGQQRWAEIRQRGENPLDCQRTRFARSFRRDETAGDEVARKYLAWIGLADGAAIERNAAQREGRASDGCDPAR
ncbi:hypothetical protein [Dokdonella koreensis]|uniref:hypothetical protein n=1 Tax=Dokdonella koreensis TaxID=323415 RepID=UPI0012378748|nr:hypothetical protein [Dokdonella koreensis]